MTDIELKKYQVELKKQELELKKQEVELKKQEVFFKKQEALLKKQEAFFKRQDGIYKREDVEYLKLCCDRKKTETTLQEATIERYKSDTEHIVKMNKLIATKEKINLIHQIGIEFKMSDLSDIDKMSDFLESGTNTSNKTLTKKIKANLSTKNSMYN